MFEFVVFGAAGDGAVVVSDQRTRARRHGQTVASESDNAIRARAVLRYWSRFSQERRIEVLGPCVTEQSGCVHLDHDENVVLGGCFG
jgi:hypothetical protein